MLRKLSTKMIGAFLIIALVFTLAPANHTVSAAAKKKTVRVNKRITIKTTKKIKKVKASKKGIVKVTYQKRAKKFKVKGLKKGKVTLTVTSTNRKKAKYQITVKKKTTVKSDPTLSKYAKQVVALVNKERTKRGLNKLKMTNSALQSAAQKRAKEITKLFSHQRPDGTMCDTVLDEYKVKYMAVGENIAMGQFSPEDVMDSWMNSPGHKANILSDSYTEIGVGVYKDDFRYYWVQIFIGN